VRLESRSEDETERIAAALGPLLAVGDVIALEGPLGAGKTRFVTGLARGIAARARVRSPTFTLVNEYHGRLSLVHVDLYRLAPPDTAALALDDAVERAALVVEWADRLPPALRAEALVVRLAPAGPSARTLEVSAEGARARALEHGWNAAWTAAEGAA
jgi:tRNA threonylcarbamoyladenosine biosynthesis protein TsaE